MYLAGTPLGQMGILSRETYCLIFTDDPGMLFKVSEFQNAS